MFVALTAWFLFHKSSIRCRHIFCLTCDLQMVPNGLCLIVGVTVCKLTLVGLQRSKLKCPFFPLSTGSRSSGSNPSAGKGRRSSPQEKSQRSACNDSEPRIRGGRRGERSASQMSHQSHTVSSHARSSLSHSQSHRSHPLSQNSHPSFSYSHAPFAQPGQGSCAHSERSHASSYGPPGLPPPYCLARLAPKPSVSSTTPPGAPPGRELAAIPPELTASRQSFQHAMGNPCEFFVDIM